MSEVEASNTPSPSSDSVQYLYGTNPTEDGEVITSGVRENPIIIEDDRGIGLRYLGGLLGVGHRNAKWFHREQWKSS